MSTGRPRPDTTVPDVVVSAGRPRDPSVEERVFRAAVALYEAEGWSGFTFDAVSARARVGKSTIYRRWRTKEDLLGDALAARTRDVTKVDTGSLHGDLVQIVDQMLANYTAPNGLVSLRLFVEAPSIPRLEARSESRIAMHGTEFEEVFERAVARGELPDHRYDRNIRETVSGATLHRVLTTPPSGRRDLRRNRRAVAGEIVDFVLRIVGT